MYIGVVYAAFLVHLLYRDSLTIQGLFAYNRLIIKQKGYAAMEKKNILTYEGLKKLEDELQDLKVVRRKEVAQKIKEAREQGDLSENA